MSHRIAIGMPVYNGEAFLHQALNSLRQQTYGDFQLVISDNASSDATEQICREFAREDPRVTYIRQNSNRGAVWNFNHLFDIADGDLFMWAAADDEWDPSFLERCQAELHRRPDAVLAFPALRRIDPEGKVIEEGVVPPSGTSSTSLVERLEALFEQKTYSHVYGLIRAQSLKRTHLMQPAWAPDVRLLFDLCIQGPAAIVPEVLYSNRVFPNKTFTEMATSLAGDEGASLSLTQPTCDLLMDLLHEVLGLEAAMSERLKIVTRVVSLMYDDNGPWRGAILAELARGMRACMDNRRYMPLAARLSMRCLLEPRTPLWVLGRWQSRRGAA